MKLGRMIVGAVCSVIALSVMAVTASAYSYDTYIMFADKDWYWSNFKAGKGGDVSVTGPGTYTVSLDSKQADNASASIRGVNVFCVDIVGGYADLEEMTVKVDSIKADGAEVQFDPDKIIYGDIEDKGNFRIEIHNAYGETKKNNAINIDDFTASNKIEVTFTVTAPVVTTVTTRATEPPETVPLPKDAPEADESTKIVPTGNRSLFSLLGIMSLAAAAAYAASAARKGE